MQSPRNRSYLHFFFSDILLNIWHAWKQELTDKTFRWKLMLVPGLFLAYSAITQQLGNFVEARKGVRLDDKLLTLFPAFDFSMPIFLLLYVSLTAMIIAHLNKPRVILRLIEMHFFVAVVRQICILCVALEAPAGLIVLRDVFIENTFYPHNTPLTKDLFFSGHVASIWIYFLCAQKKMLKWFFFGGTLLMSFMILCMRVHYTYDVYGAVFFTSLIFFTPTWIRYYVVSRKELAAEVLESNA